MFWVYFYKAFNENKLDLKKKTLGVISYYRVCDIEPFFVT